MDVYPVNLVLGGAPVLVVGAGSVAVNKVQGLLDGGADDLTVVAPRVTEEMERLVTGAGGRLERRPYRSPEAADFRLVMTATDDPDVNAQVSADATAARVWVNSADDPLNCTFIVPARVRTRNLLVTVGTGGRSPAAASWLRRRLEEELGRDLDLLVDILADEREELRSEGRPTEGLDWRGAIDAGVLDLIRRGRPDEARMLLGRLLRGGSADHTGR